MGNVIKKHYKPQSQRKTAANVEKEAMIEILAPKKQNDRKKFVEMMAKKYQTMNSRSVVNSKATNKLKVVKRHQQTENALDFNFDS